MSQYSIFGFDKNGIFPRFYGGSTRFSGSDGAG